MSKKLIIIISSTLGILFIGLVIYYLLGTGSSTENGGGNIFKNFFPFGGSDNTGSPVDNGDNNGQPVDNTGNNGTPVTSVTAKLRLLSSEAISGAGALDVKAGTLVRYIEKATGHIFEVEMFSSNKNRISNTTIPVVYDAIWGNKNNSLVARYLQEDNRTIDTYSLNIKEISTTTTNTVSGVLFKSKITEVSAFDTSIFYLEEGNGFSSGFTASFDGSKKKQIWNSPIRDLLSQYVNAKTVALTTKPYQNIPGYLYLVDTGSGQAKSVLAGVPGLSTNVNPDTTKVLYLEQAGTVKMAVYDIKTNLSTTTSPTTFPEKCVWSKKDKNIIYCAVPQTYIDQTKLTSWYTGLVSLTDDIWKYDIKNNTSSIIENLGADSGKAIDVMKPILSENEQYLIFINKIDNNLWSLDLTK